MPYTKTTWIDGTTGITAARLNNIESGVEVGYNNAILYAAASGSANSYIVTLSPVPAVLTEGMCIATKINVDSTGPCTINVNGLGAKGIKKANGNDVTNLKAGAIYTLRYNGANFQLLGEGGEGTAVASDVAAGKTFTNDEGTFAGTNTKVYGPGDYIGMANLGITGDFVSLTNSTLPTWTYNVRWVGSHIYFVSTTDGKVQKRDNDTSDVIWEATLAHNTKKAYTVDGLGNLYILIHNGVSGGALTLYKYDTSGTLLWQATIKSSIVFSTSLTIDLKVSYSGTWYACIYNPDSYSWPRVAVVNSSGTVTGEVMNNTIFIDDSGTVIGVDGPNNFYKSFKYNGAAYFSGDPSDPYCSSMGSVDGTTFLTLGWANAYSSSYTCRVNCAGGVVSFGLIIQGQTVPNYGWAQLYSAGGGVLKKYQLFGTTWTKTIPNASGSFKFIANSGKWGLWTVYFTNSLKILS